MDQATTAWLAGMTPDERSELSDVIFDFVTSGGAVRTEDLIHPKQIANYVKSLVKDEAKRTTIISSLSHLVRAFIDAQRGEE